MSTNKDQVAGRVKEAKGALKELAGKVVGNEKLQAKGKIQKIVGKAQAKFGDVKQKVKAVAVRSRHQWQPGRQQSRGQDEGGSATRAVRERCGWRAREGH